MGQATKTWKEEMAEDNARREAERAKRKQEGLETACYGYVSAVTHDSLPLSNYLIGQPNSSYQG